MQMLAPELSFLGGGGGGIQLDRDDSDIAIVSVFLLTRLTLPPLALSLPKAHTSSIKAAPGIRRANDFLSKLNCNPTSPPSLPAG